MFLLEMFKEYPTEFNNAEDNGSHLRYEDARKTRLTLKQLNRLRKMNDMRALEQQQELDFVKKMYAPPPPEAGGGLGI